MVTVCPGVPCLRSRVQGSLLGICGFRDLGLFFWVLGLRSFFLGPGSWVFCPGFLVLCPGSWVLTPCPLKRGGPGEGPSVMCSVPGPGPHYWSPEFLDSVWILSLSPAQLRQPHPHQRLLVAVSNTISVF